MRRYWPSILALACGIAAAGAAYWIIPPRCVSRATLRVTTPLPERYLPGDIPLTAERVVAEAPLRALDRHAAADLVLHHELYPGVRKRRSLRAAVDEFQRSLRVEATADDLIRIEFTHDDPAKTLMVVKEVAQRLVEQSTYDSMAATNVPGLLADEAQRTLDTFRTCRASAGADVRGQVNCEAVRARYLTLRHRMYESDLLDAVRRWHFASRVEILDQATPAVRYDTVRQWSAAGCALAGIAAAVMLFFLRRS